MGDLSRTAAIIGVDESDEIGKLPDKSRLQLGSEAAFNALDDAGLSAKDVDALFIAGPSPYTMAEYLGITPKYSDGTNVGGDEPGNDEASTGLVPASTNPAPARPPTSAWVVEIGSPTRVAASTVIAAAAATATRKLGSPTTSGGSSPLPPKASSRALASTIEASEPDNCAAVAS